MCPEYDKNVDYYKEFWRVYLQNEIILLDMKKFVEEIKTLQFKITETEVSNLKIKNLREKKNKKKK